MRTIFFFGNCQLGAIKRKLSLDLNNYEIYHEVCHLTTLNKIEFTNIINQSNIIITQNISDGYRGFDYLNLNYILSHSNDKIIIVIPSCYFNFYYPDLKYIGKPGDRLHNPNDYHHQYMVDNYKNNGGIQNYIDNYVNNPNLICKEELLSNAKDSIQELKNRKKLLDEKLKDKNNVFTLCISNFIEQNYRDKLLFYSFNHPTKYVFEFICENIINLLEIDNTIDYNIDPLGYHKSILYKCIQPLVNFDITKEEIKVNKCFDIYQIVEIYYEVYNNLDSKFKSML